MDIKKDGQDSKHAGIKTITNALSSGAGPMKTRGFASGFSLGAGPAGSFAESRIASMKSNVSEALRKQHNTKLHEDLIKKDSDAFMPKSGPDYTPDSQSGKFGSGPSYGKGKQYSWEKNIKYGQSHTADDIYTPTKTNDQGIDVTSSSSLTNKNINKNNLESSVTVHEQIKGKTVPGTGVTYEAGTSTGLNSWKATAEANKAYKASNQYKKDQAAKLKKTRSEAKENLKLGVSYDALSKSHKEALKGTRIGKKEVKRNKKETGVMNLRQAKKAVRGGMAPDTVGSVFGLGYGKDYDKLLASRAYKKYLKNDRGWDSWDTMKSRGDSRTKAGYFREQRKNIRQKSRQGGYDK